MEGTTKVVVVVIIAVPPGKERYRMEPAIPEYLRIDSLLWELEEREPSLSSSSTPFDGDEQPFTAARASIRF